MWIFTTSSFLSIVDKGGDGSTLLVRARRKGEIEAIFPEAHVEETPSNDYRFRARLDRELVAQEMAEMIRGVRYGNFKGTVHDHARHEAYMDVWDVMNRYQTTSR
jgi:hypothetical protein